MHRLGTYLPQDRLRALANGETLPSRMRGAAIFADISGFTRLTEKLTQTLGARKGVEALSHQLNAVYGALIDQVESYGGSVISFAGDSIIGWFEDADSASAALKAVSCALEMQAAIQEFNELSLKVVVSSGEARRLVVGDPSIQLMDTLAGKTVARLATAERIAQKCEIIVDEVTLQVLGDNVRIREQRIDPITSEKFSVLDTLNYHADRMSRSLLDVDKLSIEILRPWLLATVFQREQIGMISFMTELRPAVPLFLNFSGIDYDEEEAAEEKLNAFVSRAQQVITKFDGAFLQLVIGDKGSYIYAVFGAFTAHEDAPQRAVYAALELEQIHKQLPYIQSIQIGISLGTLRVGAYGNTTRQTFAALGDDVNLAARLMTTARADEILITGRVQIEVANTFTLEPRQPISMKGKGEPQPVFAVTGISYHRATRLPEPVYRLPMIGRQEELRLIDEKIKLALQGKGQIIGITAEAGMGKSRLIAEVIRLARKRGFVGYGGACQSSGTNTPYLVWQPIWQAFFDLDPEMPQRRQVRLLEGELEDRVPERLDSVPLLGLVLNLPLPDNEFTGSLDPKDRKSALEVVLEDCLKSAVLENPHLIVLEDMHWIDPLSRDLLESLARLIENLPVCLVLAYRPPDPVSSQTQRLEALPYFTKIEFKDLTPAEAELLIRAKLAQLFPERTGTLPRALADMLTLKSQGNPFFIEELLNYLHDRGLNPYDAHALGELQLPASLQTLILSRIDQLTEPLKVTLKVASIIGRVFPFSWLHGYYPSLGKEGTVKDQLAELSRLDLTPLDTPDPELAYLFKHIVTQEVAYESISYTTRAQLHELLALYLEERYPNDLLLDTLTFHYSRGNNVAKKREYLRKAGDAAKAAYANASALDYYKQALESSPSPQEAIDLHINTGMIHQLIGERKKAREYFQQALQLATASQRMPKIIESEIRLAVTWTVQAEYFQALEWLDKARAHAIQANDLNGLCDALIEIGIVHWRLTNFDQSSDYLQQSVDLARRLGDKKREAYALSMLAQIRAQTGRISEARDIFEASLALAKEINDIRRIAGIANNYALTNYYEGNYEIAQKLLQESLEIVRNVGDKRGEALSLNNLGNIEYLKNDFESAKKFYEAALALGREMDDHYVHSLALSCLGLTLFRQGKFREAGSCYQESLALIQATGDKYSLSFLHCYIGLLALAENQLDKARASFREGLALAHQADIKMYIVYNLIGMAKLFWLEGKAVKPISLLSAADQIAQFTGLKIEPELQEPYDEVIAQAKRDCSEDDFQLAWEAGRKMDIEHAVKFAMEK